MLTTNETDYAQYTGKERGENVLHLLPALTYNYRGGVWIASAPSKIQTEYENMESF